MSKHKPPKTSGLEWLGHSMGSFNGSGYADSSTPESYVQSYIAYKKWTKRPEAAQLALDNIEFAFEVACKLANARPAGHTPKDKKLNSFKQFYSQEANNLFA